MPGFDPRVDEYERGYWNAFYEVVEILENHGAEMRRKRWPMMVKGNIRSLRAINDKFGKGRP